MDKDKAVSLLTHFTEIKKRLIRISIIVISVSIFGLVLFVFVKNLMKRRIEYYLKLNEKNKKTK